MIAQLQSYTITENFKWGESARWWLCYDTRMMKMSYFSTVQYPLLCHLENYYDVAHLGPASLRFMASQWKDVVTPTQRFNPLRPRQNGHHFTDDTLNRIFLNEMLKINTL